MSRNLFDLRFGIRRHDSYVSGIWRVWVTRQGDVYLAIRTMAGIDKYSFHRSGICRRAFTSQHGTPSTMSDRAMFKWRRLETPPAGTGRASRVAWIAFPTDYLSSAFDPDDGRVVWIDAAPLGGATYVELAYTLEPEGEIKKVFSDHSDRRLLGLVELPSSERLLIDFYHADWQNNDLRIPGEGEVRDLLFSAADPHNTGRPIRLQFGPAPPDGEAVVIQELGGFVSE
jgi:hypothetical protein